jgi:uncharacterized protein YqeY
VLFFIRLSSENIKSREDNIREYSYIHRTNTHDIERTEVSVIFHYTDRIISDQEKDDEIKDTEEKIKSVHRKKGL